MAAPQKKVAVKNPSQKRNWYEDRYQSALVQRNLLLLVVLLALVGVSFAVITVLQISSSKKISPFVIQVEGKTGITSVVQPLDKFSTNEVIQKYFLMKYLNARETYSFHDYRYQYYTVVRLLSDDNVYNGFRRWLVSEAGDSPLRYGDKLDRTINVKSFAYLPTNRDALGYTVQVRFVQMDVLYKRAQNPKHKIATINFDFFPMRLTNEEQYINPLGFQVLSYRIDNEIQ